SKKPTSFTRLVPPRRLYFSLQLDTLTSLAMAAPSTGTRLVAHSSSSSSSVILTSHFEATRALFWDGPRNFEPQSDDKDDTRDHTPSPNFRITPAR
ncbi:hypothetical protein AVEN_20252-1, partial [Araneus ventricosus]